MTERAPTKVTNLDGYGNPALLWSRAQSQLTDGPLGHSGSVFLGTVRPDGRPHAVGVGALWYDGDIYVVNGPNAQRTRNLETNPACTVSMSLEGIDLVFEGEASRVTDPEVLEATVALFREGGWPAQVEGDAFTAPFSAPSAGPPPWHLYRIVFHTVYGVAGAEPYGATRWSFSD